MVIAVFRFIGGNELLKYQQVGKSTEVGAILRKIYEETLFPQRRKISLYTAYFLLYSAPHFYSYSVQPIGLKKFKATLFLTP